jgi:Domain of unknown function (DUF4347)
MIIARLTQQLLNQTILGAQAALWESKAEGAPSPKKPNRKFKYLTLEPRVMFDAAMADTAEHVQHDINDAMVYKPRIEDHSLFDALAEPVVADVPVVLQVEVAFIDDSLPDLETLIADLGPNVEIHLINSQADGIDQIADVLAGRSDIAALHILSHGEAGVLHVGNGLLTAETMRSHYANELAVIRSALSENADLLIYGCDFAAGDAGRAAAQALADATGADVAASEDLTGSADLGGDWVLEDRTGAIEARILDARDWHGILAPLNIAISSAPAVFTSAGVPATTVVAGGYAIWSNAGTIGSTAIDLRATVVSITASNLSFITQGDDASIVLNSPGDVVVKWEIFAAGTNIPAVGSPNFNIVDVDGAGGVPNSREIVIPQLNGLTSYTLDAITHEVVSISAAGVNVSGTQNETANPPVSISQVQFSWQNVSTWTVKYSLNGTSGFGNAVFRHDGNGSFAFTTPNTVSLLAVDLDANNSTLATGADYQGNYLVGAAGVRIADVDATIVQNAALGANLGKATIVLTNAQLGDVLTIGALPGGLTSSIDTSVAGKITVTLTGSTTVANYQTAL